MAAPGVRRPRLLLYFARVLQWLNCRRRRQRNGAEVPRPARRDAGALKTRAAGRPGGRRATRPGRGLRMISRMADGVEERLGRILIV